MNPLVAGALVGVGGSLLGGLLGQDAAEQSAETNTKINNRNNDLQMMFAQQGVRWKVDDAKAAGIHPLYALGAQTHSFSPSSIGSTPDYSMSTAASNMGQDISRAVTATKTQTEREIAQLQIASLNADVEGKVLDNQMRMAQLNKMSLVGPALPSGVGDATAFIPGQGNANTLKVKPAERFASQSKSHPEQVAGWQPTVEYGRTKNGLRAIIPKDLAESMEDDLVGKILWNIENRLMPNFGVGKAPGNAPPKDHEWNFDVKSQQWIPQHKNSKRMLFFIP